MPRKSTIRPEDIYEIRQPSVCRLSPDGSRLLVAVSQPNKEKLANQMSLWMVDLRDEAAKARRFTQGGSVDANPRWSPDGTRIAFISNRDGKSELYIIDANGGEARQLTKLAGSIADFDWHPSGQRLVIAFTPRDEEAREREEKKKKGDPGFEAPMVREIHRLYYKLDGAGFIPKGRSHLWSVDAETGKAKPLTDDDRYDEGEPRFSPDGRWIYFASNRTAEPDRNFMRMDLWCIPARGGKVEKIRTFDGPSGTASMSPDGQWIAFIGRQRADEPWNQHHDKLWLVSSNGGRPSELTTRLDRGVGNTTINDTFGFGTTAPPVWSPDGQWVYFVVSSEGNSEVWRVHIRERKPEAVLAAPGAVLDFAIDFAGGWIHSTFADTSNPGEVRSDPLPETPRRGASRRPARGEKARSTVVRSTFNSEWLSNRTLAVPEELWFEGKSRNRLQGWVLNPPGMNKARKYPGMLYIHGGPATQYGRTYFHEFQTLAARGYVVFYCNPRGGTGYAEKHLNAIVGRWGTHDYDDVMTFTDVVLRKARHLDRRRLAVGGGSYGGYMTNWIIGHTDRFACAVTSRSISNLLSFVGSSDFGYAWPQEFNCGQAWEDVAYYLKYSPLTYLKHMKTPTLIEHQEEDHRCPMEQAEQLWTALKWKGVPCEFYRYPNEPHGMSRGGRPDRRIHRMEKIVAWLDRWTKK